MLSPKESLNAVRPTDRAPDDGATTTEAGDTGRCGVKTISTDCDSLTLVDRLVELNNSFAQSILEVSRSYLQSIEHLQDNMLQANANFAAPSAPAKRCAATQHPDSREAVTAQIIRLSEASRLQLAWANRVSDKYMAEADRLVHLAQQTTQNSWSPVFPKGPPPDRDAASSQAE